MNIEDCCKRLQNAREYEDLEELYNFIDKHAPYTSTLEQVIALLQKEQISDIVLFTGAGQSPEIVFYKMGKWEIACYKASYGIHCYRANANPYDYPVVAEFINLTCDVNRDAEAIVAIILKYLKND